MGEPLSREARLRPEFAKSYPSLSPNVWESATVVIEKMVAWRLQHGVGGLFRWDHVLNPDHFEFRSRPGSRLTSASRSANVSK
jgi:hypothetical protein